MTKFVVWQRNDGYVGATTYKPSDYHNPITNPGVFVTYEVIGEFEVWEDALEVIKALQP